MKKFAIILFVRYIFSIETCSNLQNTQNQSEFLNVNYIPQNFERENEQQKIYRIKDKNYLQISQFFQLAVRPIRDEQHLIKIRQAAKHRKALFFFDTTKRFFPAYCSYFENEQAGIKYSYLIVEKGGQNIGEMFEKEKFVILKKMIKIITILHTLDLIACDVSLNSFKIYKDQKNDVENLISEIFKAENIRYSRMITLVENKENNNCPVIEKFQGKEAPEQINREILFDSVEKKFKQQQDIYQLAFIFLDFFLDQSQLEQLKQITLQRNQNNIKKLNQKIIDTVEQFLLDQKIKQIPQEYHLSFDYFIGVVKRMLDYSPQDRLNAFDIFQALVVIILNETTEQYVEQIKTSQTLQHNEIVKKNTYENHQLFIYQTDKSKYKEFYDYFQFNRSDKYKQNQEFQTEDGDKQIQKENIKNIIDLDQKKQKQNSV